MVSVTLMGERGSKWNGRNNRAMPLDRREEEEEEDRE